MFHCPYYHCYCRFIVIVIVILQYYVHCTQYCSVPDSQMDKAKEIEYRPFVDKAAPRPSHRRHRRRSKFTVIFLHGTSFKHHSQLLQQPVSSQASPPSQGPGGRRLRSRRGEEEDGDNEFYKTAHI
jgi:hypothetical protein